MKVSLPKKFKHYRNKDLNIALCESNKIQVIDLVM